MTKTTSFFSTYQEWLRGGLAALIVFGFYLATLAPTVLEADSGEFQFVAWLPGIAHPPGYPLYILLGWLWTHLFAIGEVAWRMNLLSAIFAALTVGFTYHLARKLFQQVYPQTAQAAQRVAAFGTALTFGLTPTFWSQAIIAEVYTLHALFVGLILRLALSVRQQGCNLHATSFKLLTFGVGLSLTHHVTTILLLPALVLFLLWPQKGEPPTSWRLAWPQGVSSRTLLGHLALFILPTLLYLYIPLIASSTPYATIPLSPSQTLTLYDHSVTGFINHVRATVFTGELQPTAVGSERFALVGQLLLAQVGWAGVGLASLGLLTLLFRKATDLLLLTGLSALALTVFNLIYFIGDVFVLFIPVWLIVVLWLGLGGLSLSQTLAEQFVKSKANSKEIPIFGQMVRRLEDRIYQLITVTLVVICLGGIIGFMATRNFELGQANNYAAQTFWQGVLAEDIPQNTILLSNDRNEIMPMWYYQYVDGVRPDLQGLFPLIVPDPAYANVGRLLDQALASERPVYLIKPMAGLELKAALQPRGRLFQAIRNDHPPTHPIQRVLPKIMVGDNTESIMLLGYDLSPAKITPGDTITITLHWQATQPLTIDYTSYIHLIDTQGQGQTQSDHQPGGIIYPSSQWHLAEILQDRHQLHLPPNLPPGSYQLRVGMYHQPEPGIFEGMGSGQIIGEVTISR